MKPEEKNVDEVLKQYWSSAPQEEAESDCNRVLHRLRAAAEHSPKEHRSNFGFLSFFGTRIGMMSAAAAAVLFAVVIGTTLVQTHRAPAMVEKSGGTVAMGEVVRADAGGSTLVLADGSRVEMRAQSELVLERANDGVRIRLNNGDVIVSAAKQHGHLYVQTKDVMVSVVGTVFLVKAEETGSRVAVIEGEVHVRQGETDQKLKPGDQVKTNPLMESQPVSQEIAWSSRAPEHMALLQQSASPRQGGVAETRLTFEEASIRPHLAAAGDGRGGGSNMSPFGPGCAASNPEIDPKRFAVFDTTVWTLIAWAYSGHINALGGCDDLTPLNVISGGPEWIKTDKWDVQAVIPVGSISHSYNSARPMQRNEKAPELQKMILNLLEVRLKLVLRRDVREIPAYALTMPERGTPKLTYPGAFNNPLFKQDWDVRPSGDSRAEPGGFSGKDVYMTDLISMLARETGRPVVDRTGFTDQFTFFLSFRPLNSNNPRVANMSTIFKAIEEQVGLKLEETKTTVETWTIDRIEKPSEN